MSICFISSATPAPIPVEKGSESTEVLLKSLQALQHLKKQPNIIPEMEKVHILNYSYNCHKNVFFALSLCIHVFTVRITLHAFPRAQVLDLEKPFHLINH